MVLLNEFIISALLASATLVSAHTDHPIRAEVLQRRELVRPKPRTLGSCAEHLKARGVDAAGLKRRETLAEALRAERGLPSKRSNERRAFSNYNFLHQSTNPNINLNTSTSSLFSSNSSCTLQPDVTQGPYYVNGELIRQNVTETQSGIPLYIDIQVIDASTCSPAQNVYLDLWGCNATGIYSGIVAAANGNPLDSSNINTTFLRGIQQSNSAGVVQFNTIVPGHYTGRTNHLHILTHASASTAVAPNNTLLGGAPGSNSSLTYASHVGQIFFDQALISAVEATLPYSTNTQAVTLNSADLVLAQEATTTDPFVNYVYLGSSVSDGILAWITIAINTSEANAIQAGSTIYNTGGISNKNITNNFNLTGSASMPNGFATVPIPGNYNGSYYTSFVASGGATATYSSMNGSWTGVMTPTTSASVVVSGIGSTATTTATSSVLFSTASGAARIGAKGSAEYALWSKVFAVVAAAGSFWWS